MSLFSKFLSFSLVTVSVFACATNTEVTSTEEDTSEENITASKSCGANYAAANTLYKEAVAKAKLYNKSGPCDSEVYQQDIAVSMESAIQKCEAFRGVYTKSVYAAPVRTALKGNIIDGILQGKGVVDSLAGSSFYARRPGAGPESTIVRFTSATEVAVDSIQWNEQQSKFVTSTKAQTYSISQPRCVQSSTCPILFVEFSDGTINKLMLSGGEYVLVDEMFDLDKDNLFDPAVLSNYQDVCSA